jgi:hypothetical protein
MQQGRPSDEADARVVVAEHIERLRERGYDDLRHIAGKATRSFLGGRVQFMDGPGTELSEAIGPSGALYHVVTDVDWHIEEGGELQIRVEIQEDAEPGGWFDTSFLLDADGAFQLRW